MSQLGTPGFVPPFATGVSREPNREIIKTDQIKLKEFSDAQGVIGFRAWLAIGDPLAQIYVGRGDEETKDNIPLVRAANGDEPAAFVGRHQLRLYREGWRYYLANNVEDRIQRLGFQAYDPRESRFAFRELVGPSDVRARENEKVSFIRLGFNETRFPFALVDRKDQIFFVNLSHPDFNQDEIVKKMAFGESKYDPQPIGTFAKNEILIDGLTMKAWKKAEAMES